MQHPIATVKINAQTLTTARERARQIGELFGLDTMHRTRFVTAVSEIARNTVKFAAEGSLEFLFDTQPRNHRIQCLVARFTDRGTGLADFRGRSDVILAHNSDAERGIGAVRRLVDHLYIDCPAEGGTVVTLESCLPRGHKPLSTTDIRSRAAELSVRKVLSPVEAMELQHREMLVTLDELRRRQLSLEQADVRKNEFMAMLAHELRNPLAAIKLNLAIMELKPTITGPELAERREVMSRQVNQITRMVADLVDVARVERGKVELRESPVEVNGLVKDALEMTAAAIMERKHQVAFQAAPHDLWLQGDSARLLQVFSNVIHNAAKYTPERGRIEIAVRSQDAQAVIEVSDNGVGIGADMLPHVFALFVQVRDKSADGDAGMGVGLTLAERLVHDHGGTISVESKGAGCGSQFTIKLPLLADVHPGSGSVSH